jgi:hypothetical protein
MAEPTGISGPWPLLDQGCGSEVLTRADRPKLRAMRDIETIDADLRLVSRAWRVARVLCDRMPSTALAWRTMPHTGYGSHPTGASPSTRPNWWPSAPRAMCRQALWTEIRARERGLGTTWDARLAQRLRCVEPRMVAAHPAPDAALVTRVVSYRDQ